MPPNVELHQDEAKAIGAILDSRSFRRIGRNEYTDEQWRMHCWAHYRLTAMADAKIQDELGALKQRGQEENTLGR